jgi:antitoxin YefM
MIEVSYSEARAHLAELLDRISDDREVVRIRRQGAKPSAVLIDAEEYASLEETAHLLSSPANVRHLLQALVELQTGQGTVYQSVDDLWRDLKSESSTAAAPRRRRVQVDLKQVEVAPRTAGPRVWGRQRSTSLPKKRAAKRE